MNEWWDRPSRTEMPCTRDRSTRPVSYGATVAGPGDSAVNLRTSTLPDELRAQLSPTSRAISFSLKARSAIPLGGHRPNAVAWFDDSGTWVTSTAFSPGPVREVADYIQRHPVENDFGRVWTRTLPVGSYLVRASRGWRRPPRSTTAWLSARARRWCVNARPGVLLAVAEQSVRGRLPRVDGAGRRGPGCAWARATRRTSIAVGFSTLDKVGHDFGPNSHEIQDVLVRLDRTLVALFAGLDRMVGAGQYVVALTADHGVAPIPERALAQGLDAGRVAKATLDGCHRRGAAADPRRGPVRRPDRKQRRLSRARRLRPDAGVARGDGRGPERARSRSGVARVFTRDQIIDDGSRTIPSAGASQTAYDRERSGDVVVLLKPYWLTDDSASPTSHGRRMPTTCACRCF